MRKMHVNITTLNLSNPSNIEFQPFSQVYNNIYKKKTFLVFKLKNKRNMKGIYKIKEDLIQTSDCTTNDSLKTNKLYYHDYRTDFLSI
jgi:hypothetical protein